MARDHSLIEAHIPLETGFALGTGDPKQTIFHWLALGQSGLALAFFIPTCWYLQREMVALGV